MLTKYEAELRPTSRAEQLLHEAEATHLRARHYGATVTVKSGPAKGSEKGHAAWSVTVIAFHGTLAAAIIATSTFMPVR